MVRNSIVGFLKINAVVFASTIQIGDLQNIHSRTKAMAVQREKAEFTGSEGHFEFPIFHRPIPEPVLQNTVKLNAVNINPDIKVGAVRVISVSSSGTVQVGSTRLIELESRVKHIRQLLPRREKSASPEIPESGPKR